MCVCAWPLCLVLDCFIYQLLLFLLHHQASSNLCSCLSLFSILCPLRSQIEISASMKRNVARWKTATSKSWPIWSTTIDTRPTRWVRPILSRTNVPYCRRRSTQNVSLLICLPFCSVAPPSSNYNSFVYDSLYFYAGIKTEPHVQAPEVSSSRPSLERKDFSHLVLDALNCFIFTLNADGYIDFVSDNVGKFIKYSQVCICCWL